MTAWLKKWVIFKWLLDVQLLVNLTEKNVLSACLKSVSDYDNERKIGRYINEKLWFERDIFYPINVIYLSISLSIYILISLIIHDFLMNALHKLHLFLI